MVSKIHLHLLMLDGTPDGVIKCHQENRTCVAYKVPKPKVNELQKIDEFQKSGIYFLFGNNTDEKQCLYIGQAINRKNGKGLLLRVQEHLKEEEWNEAVLITTKDNTFTPTKISCLENVFYRLSLSAKRYIVRNGNEPNPGNYTEDEESDLEDIIECIKFMVAGLGYKAFDKLAKNSTKEEQFTLKYKKGNGIAIQTSDGFVLLKGSTINEEITTSCPESTKRLRQIYADKVTKDKKVKEDILFSSPSAAASFISGSSINGMDCWKNSSGKSLKELSEEM